MDFKDIKINGRYQIKDNELYLFNSGSGISFKMKGTSFIVALNSEIGPCYYYLIIDRDYENKTKIFVPEHAKHQYLFNDDKEHLIDIVKEDGFFNENLKQVVISGFNDNRTQLKKKMDMFTDDFNRIMKEKGFGDINYQSNMLGFDSFMDRMDLPPEGPRKLDDMKDNFQGVRPFGDKPPKEPR